MSRQLSNQLKAQIFAAQSDDPFLTLLTFTHPDLTSIRLVNNQEDIVSRSNTYQAFPFKIAFPTDDGESLPEIQLVLDNASLDLIEPLRTITTPAFIELETVLASTPDVVEFEFTDLELKGIVYNNSTITASLALSDFLGTQIPGEVYDPTRYRGLFA